MTPYAELAIYQLLGYDTVRSPGVPLVGGPLADMANTTTIRVVVADGRYCDRAALGMLTEVWAKARLAKAKPRL